MTVNQVCRLCLSDKELYWIFDQKCNSSVKKLNYVILMTTGIEVLEKDIVSQKICSNCCNVTQKMFQFRQKAIKADKFLRDQCRERLKNNEVVLKIPNTSLSIKKLEKKKDTNNSIKVENKISFKPVPKTNGSKEVKGSSEVIPANKPENSKLFQRKVHPSIKRIFCMYRNLKLSPASITMDLNPFVSMEMDSVETYFRQHNLDMKKHVQKVLRYYRASKKTGKAQSIESSTINNEDSTSVKENTNNGNKKVSPIGIRIEEYPGIENSTISKTNQNSTIIDCENKEVGPINIRLGIGNSQSKRSLEDKCEEKPLKIKRQGIFSNEPNEGPLTFMQTLRLKRNLDVPRCNICNYATKKSYELKKHYRQHFKCTYCKATFKTIVNKEKHDIKCQIKYALTNQVRVLLEKISIAEETSVKENKPLKNDAIIELIDDENNKSLVQSPQQIFVSVKTHLEASTLDQVEPEVSTLVSAFSQSPKSVLLQHEVLIPSDKLQTSKLDQEQHQASTAVQVQPKSSTLAPISTQAFKSCLPSTAVKVQSHSIQTSLSGQVASTSSEVIPQISTDTESVPFSTVTVTPFIEITDNASLNTINTSGQNIGVLKDVLKNSDPGIKFTNITSFSSNHEVNKDPINENVVFKNVVSQMYLYKIPLNVKKADFKLSFVENKQSEERKNIDHWHSTENVNLGSENGYFITPNPNDRIRQGTSNFTPTTQTPTSTSLTELSNMQTNVGNKQGNIQTRVDDAISENSINLHESQLHNLPSKIGFNIVGPSNKSMTSSRNNINTTSTNMQQAGNSIIIRRKLGQKVSPNVNVLPNQKQTSNVQKNTPIQTNNIQMAPRQYGKNNKSVTSSQININSTNTQQRENSMVIRSNPELQGSPNVYFVPNPKQTSNAQRITPMQINNVQTAPKQYGNSNQTHKLPQQVPTTGNGNSSVIFSEALYNLNQNKHQIFSNTRYVVPSNNQIVTSSNIIKNQKQSLSLQNSTSTSNIIGSNNIPSTSKTNLDRAHYSVLLHSNFGTSRPRLSQKPVSLNNTLVNNPMLNNLVITNPLNDPSVQCLVPNLTTSSTKTMSTNNRLSTNADTTFTNSVVSKSGDVTADKIEITRNVESSNTVMPLLRVRDISELM